MHFLSFRTGRPHQKTNLFLKDWLVFLIKKADNIIIKIYTFKFQHKESNKHGNSKMEQKPTFFVNMSIRNPNKAESGEGGGSHALLLHPPLFFCTLHFVINFAPICNGCPFVITVALIKLPQFVTAFALISNNTKLSQFVTKACLNL